jgi:hypothetical protein
MRASVPRCLLVLLVSLVLGCNSGSVFGPSALAGTYGASTFNLVHGVDTTDVLTAGGSLVMVLAPTGATSGTLTLPASLNGGTVFVADMAGTFSITDGKVHFAQGADTFVRDLAFTVATAGSVMILAGSATFSDTTVNVVLTRGGVLLRLR